MFIHKDFPKKEFCHLFALMPADDICSSQYTKYIGKEKFKQKGGLYDFQYYFWRIYFPLRNNRKDNKQIKSNFIYI